MVDVGNKKINLCYFSDKTKELIYLYALMLKLSNKGGVIIIDDFELNKWQMEAFIKMCNVHKVQLIFSTNNTQILDEFDIDSVTIIEKNMDNSSEIYAIEDIRDIRRDVPISRWYDAGKFGGIPSIKQYIK